MALLPEAHEQRLVGRRNPSNHDMNGRQARQRLIELLERHFVRHDRAVVADGDPPFAMPIVP
jgi:hypothetical protein